MTHTRGGLKTAHTIPHLRQQGTHRLLPGDPFLFLCLWIFCPPQIAPIILCAATKIACFSRPWVKMARTVCHPRRKIGKHHLPPAVENGTRRLPLGPACPPCAIDGCFTSKSVLCPHTGQRVQKWCILARSCSFVGLCRECGTRHERGAAWHTKTCSGGRSPLSIFAYALLHHVQRDGLYCCGSHGYRAGGQRTSTCCSPRDTTRKLHALEEQYRIVAAERDRCHRENEVLTGHQREDANQLSSYHSKVSPLSPLQTPALIRNHALLVPKRGPAAVCLLIFCGATSCRGRLGV